MKKEIEKMNELKNIIIENPNLPIRFFIGEDGNCGECNYEENSINDVVVDSLTLYEGRYYNEEDFGEELYGYLYNEFESEEKLNKHIDEIIKSKDFKKAICVFIG